MSYMGFSNLESKLAAKGIRHPGALAAVIGRRKYGKRKFNKAARTGHSLKGAKPLKRG